MLAESNGGVLGRPVPSGPRGGAYDVRRGVMGSGGRHSAPRAGRGLASRLVAAPHGAEMPTSMPCVGILVGDDEDEAR
jgi:predicted heme/steroid binding protein